MNIKWAAVKRRALKHILAMSMCALNAFLLLWLSTKLAHIVATAVGVQSQKYLAVAIAATLLFMWWAILAALGRRNRNRQPSKPAGKEV